MTPWLIAGWCIYPCPVLYLSFSCSLCRCFSATKSEMEHMIGVRTIHFFHPLSRRMHVVVVLMIGCFCMAYTRSSLGMTMTCMINSTAIALQQKPSSRNMTLKVELEAIRCSTTTELDRESKKLNKNISIAEEVSINNYGGEIVWDSDTVNLIFTGTFWGSLIGTIPGGYFADRTSPINVLLFASVALSLTSALFPYFALNFNQYAVFMLRVLTGIGEGLLIPAVNAIIGRWIPNLEKSQAASLFTIGAQMSGAVGVPISASFCASSFRWPGVFYFSSISALIWAVILKTTTANSPSKVKCMTKIEREYLEHSLEDHRPISKGPHSIPWRDMLTSKPVLACFYASFTSNTLMALIHSYQPMFLKEVFFLKMMDNGVFSALPHVGQMIVKMIWSVGIDSLKQRKVVSNTAGCRISQVVASSIGTSMLLAIAFFSDCAQPQLVLIFFIILGCGHGPATSGFYTSIVTLAPAHVGVLSSISMLVGCGGMLFTPLLVSIFRSYGTADEWSRVFIAIAVMSLSSGMVFGCFASGEVQSWGVRRRDTMQEVVNADPLLTPNAKTEAALVENFME